MTDEGLNPEGLSTWTRDADAEVLNRLLELDNACSRLRQLDETARDAIVQATESWRSAKSWMGQFILEPDSISWWICPPHWQSSSEGRPTRTFELSFLVDGDYPEDEFFLTSLLAESLTDLQVAFQRTSCARNSVDRAWETSIELVGPRLKQIGFQISGDEIFRDVSMPKAAACDAARRGDFAIAVAAHWTAIMNSLEQAVPAIDLVCRLSRTNMDNELS